MNAQEKLKDELFLQSTRHLTNDELCELLGVNYAMVTRHRGKLHHAAKGNSNSQKAFVSEEFASAWLKSKGINNKLMGYRYSFDILALGKVRIDVKVAYTTWRPPSQRKNVISPSWRFRVRGGDKRNDTDFYLCVIEPAEDVFVIPSRIVPKKRDLIRFAWPTLRPELSKWQHYLDAYDLIFEFAD